MNNEYSKNIVNMLNIFLANLVVFRNKLYNFHFNVIGPSFSTIHKQTNEYYNYFNDLYDKVAERIKMFDSYPVMNFNQIENVSEIKDVASKDYNGNEVKKSILNDMYILLNMTDQIGNYANSVTDLNTLVLIADVTSYLEKQIWLIRSSEK